MLAVSLLSDHFDQDSLGSAAVELSVKDLFPGAEIEGASSDGHSHLSAHDLSLEMGIPIVLSRAVVPVLVQGLMGSQPFQPVVIVVEEPLLVVIDIDAGSDVHGVDQTQSILYPAPSNHLFNPGGDVEIGPAAFSLKGQIFSEVFHNDHPTY